MQRLFNSLGLLALLTACGCCASFHMEPPPGGCGGYSVARTMQCGCTSCGAGGGITGGHPQFAEMAQHVQLPGAPRPVSPVQPAARFHPVPTKPVFEPVPDEATFAPSQR